MVALLLTLSLISTPTDLPQTDFTLHVDVIRHVSVTQSDLDLARETAASLLRAAHVALDWRDCDASMALCSDVAHDVASIHVRLVHAISAGHDDDCGAVIQDPRSHIPGVLVYVPAVDDKVLRFRLRSTGRSDPRISTLRRGHLIGLVVAHELGHALGLRHAQSGVMKANLDEDDILALRQSRLTFLAGERARILDAFVAAAREHQSPLQGRGQ